MLADANLKSFHGRLGRIEKAHRKGYGFEAAGTLGRSSTFKRERTFGQRLRVLLVVALLGFALKGVIHFNVGAEAWDTRVSALSTGTEIDRTAARLMAADPLTLMISAFLGEVFPQA